MPDQLNKQSLVNLLIDSPLREPIKINLIDIVNNTTEPDLPKVFPTIVKELEIFQKATERRMKLADETIAKLGGTNPKGEDNLPTPPTMPTATPTPSIPPLDLPPLPTTPTEIPSTPTPLSVPPLDLPPLPTITSTPVMPEPPVAPMPTAPQTPVMPQPAAQAPAEPRPTLPNLEPLGGPATTTSSDEDALAEIQKELESLKAGVASDAAPAQAPVAPPQA